MTIDLGYASLEHPEGYRLSVVDVPGHEDLIRNMVSGATSFDLVLWVVDATEGLMPQSLEHLNILDLLQIRALIPVLTKSDNATAFQISSTCLEIEKKLLRLTINRTRIFVVDSVSRRGLEPLKSKIFELARLSDPWIETDPIVHIDRSFVQKGVGAILTGTLARGRLSEGDEVALSTLPGTWRIRSLHNHHLRVATIVAGHRVGVNLVGLGRNEVRRGAVLLKPEHRYFARVVNCRIRIVEGVPFDWKPGLHLHFYTGTRELMCRTWGLSVSASATWIQIELPTKIACYPGQRFILRNTNPKVAIGGGEILDLSYDKYRTITPAEQRAYLQMAISECWLSDYVASIGIRALDVRVAARRWMTSEAELRRQATSSSRLRMSDAPSNGREPIWVWDLETELQLTRKIQTYVVGKMDKQTKISFEEMGSNLGISAPFLKTFLRLIDVGSDIRDRISIRLNAFAVTLLPRVIRLDQRETVVAGVLIERLATAGLRPPSIRTLCEEEHLASETAERVVAKLCADGLLIQVSVNIVLHHEAARLLRAFPDQVGLNSFRVTEFGAALGLPRRYTVPYLEFLQKERITRRDGDRHYRL